MYRATIYCWLCTTTRVISFRVVQTCNEGNIDSEGEKFYENSMNTRIYINWKRVLSRSKEERKIRVFLRYTISKFSFKIIQNIIRTSNFLFFVELESFENSDGKEK